jgi:hypothetical protein
VALNFDDTFLYVTDRKYNVIRRVTVAPSLDLNEWSLGGEGWGVGGGGDQVSIQFTYFLTFVILFFYSNSPIHQ